MGSQAVVFLSRFLHWWRWRLRLCCVVFCLPGWVYSALAPIGLGVVVALGKSDWVLEHLLFGWSFLCLVGVPVFALVFCDARWGGILRLFFLSVRSNTCACTMWRCIGAIVCVGVHSLWMLRIAMRPQHGAHTSLVGDLHFDPSAPLFEGVLVIGSWG